MTSPSRVTAADDLRKYMAEEEWDHGITLLDEALTEAKAQERERLTQDVVRGALERTVYSHDRDGAAAMAFEVHAALLTLLQEGDA